MYRFGMSMKTYENIADTQTELERMLQSLKRSRLQAIIERAEEGMDAIEIAKRRRKTKKLLTHQEVLKRLNIS
jgi:DNA-directed RNA polymerase specialized sigma24 family protein